MKERPSKFHREMTGQPYYEVEYEPKHLVEEELDVYVPEPPRPRTAPEILVFWAEKLKLKRK